MSQSEPTGIETLLLAESRERIPLQGRDPFRQASERMVRQARRTLDIFTYDLDKPVFDQEGFLEAVKQLALACRGIGIRILLQDSERARREGHRLVDLSRRVTSKMEIRRPHEDYIDHPENFIVVDRIGYIKRRISGIYEGEANFCHPMQARLLTDFFSEVWERSEQESNLRRLHL